jgi:NAD(P)H-dependent flavin oxidoreductase YrpB (nitropropane dioxygenase family)
VTTVGLVEGDTRAGVLPGGQVVGMLDDLPACRDLIEQIVAEAEAVIGKLPAVLG